MHIIAKEAASRQIAAAMTSAVFNLVIKHQHQDSDVSEPPPVSIAPDLQHVVSEHAQVPDPILEAHQGFQYVLPAQMHKRDSQATNTDLIANVKSAPEALDCSAALAAAPDGVVLFLENLIPAPADTTSVGPSPSRID